MKNKLAIIIINWRRYDDTVECLRSVKASNYQDYRIILVDNASDDGSGEKLAKEFPDIKAIFNKKNYGFAEGNNIGIKQALKDEAKYILLLNNDAVVGRDCLSNLIAVMEHEPATGIIGPKIYFYNANTVWYAGGKLNRLTGLTFHIGEGVEDRGQFSQPAEVDFVTGCALMVKSEVFERVGLLDKDFYHNHEDAEFCLRAKAAGFGLTYEPSAIVYHKLARSTGGGRSPFALYFKTRNHLLFQKKRGLRAPLFWPVFAWLVLKRIAGSILLLRPKGAWATIKAIKDFYAGNWGKGSGDEFR